MKIGVCGIACEKRPRMVRGACPSCELGCTPKRTGSARWPPAPTRKELTCLLSAPSNPVRPRSLDQSATITVSTSQGEKTDVSSM